MAGGVKVRGSTSVFFAVSTKGNRFCDFLFASSDNEAFEKGSTLRGKILEE